MPQRSIVLDASMAVAWAFEDEHTLAVLSALERVSDDGATVPSIWRLEVANAFRSAVRRKRCDEVFVDQAIALIDRSVIEVDSGTDRHAWGDTLRLSRKHDLTSYDAAYLELAVRRRFALASVYRALVAAAVRYDLEVVG